MVIIVQSYQCFVITIILFSCLSLSSNNKIFVETTVKSFDKLPLNSHINGANTYTNTQNMANIKNLTKRGSCSTTSDCKSIELYCDTNEHKCKCKSDFVSIKTLINKTQIESSIPTCLQIAKLDERCFSQDQCVVSHTSCQYVDPGVGHFKNTSSYYCKCREGYHQEDKEETIIINGHHIFNHPICGEFVSMGNSWIGTFVIVCIMLLIILIGSFIGIIRFQRWKQRPLASTVTSLAATSGHTSHLMSSSPPPMGSVEAEFQNDFIQVFPMHHLEPLPDKNTTHTYVIK